MNGTESTPGWLAAEPLVRLGIFIAVLAAMALWELALPLRGDGPARTQRWPGNLGLAVADTVVLRLVFPAAAVGFAVVAEQRGWGLLSSIALPSWLAIPAAVLFLDLVIYFQHVLFHAVPLLWRLHRVHHTDLAVDATTGLRFHPLEILASMAIKIAAIAAIGAPPLAVLIFEVLLNATTMFNHGNVRIAQSVDRYLRLVVVTPDMHRVHHSILRRETNSNFGFNFPWWDRWLGTYRAQPAAGHAGMTLGVEQFREAGASRLDRLLLQPFSEPPTVYPVDGGPES